MAEQTGWAEGINSALNLIFQNQSNYFPYLLSLCIIPNEISSQHKIQGSL